MQSSLIRRKTIADQIVKGAFLFITLLCASIIFFIVLFIFIRGIKPFTTNYLINGEFYKVNFFKFLTGNYYFKSPNIYGIGYIILNTLYVVLLCMILAIPISILSALFIVKMSNKYFEKILSTVIELLAAIPSIIYGLFGVGIINKIVNSFALSIGYQSAGGLSTLSAVLVLTIMSIPTISMISITSIKAVKNDVINGSLALGASMTQTNFKIVLTEAKSGIFSGIILGIGRALGEATAVSMVCGNSLLGPSFNLFSTTSTLTSTMLLGITEVTGLEYDIRFSIGLVLIVIILVVNVLLSRLKRKI